MITNLYHMLPLSPNYSGLSNAARYNGVEGIIIGFLNVGRIGLNPEDTP